MPKLRATTEEKEMRRFNRFISGWMKDTKTRQVDLAKHLDLERQSVGSRLNGETRWTLQEMAKACEFFGVTYTIGGEK